MMAVLGFSLLKVLKYIYKIYVIVFKSTQLRLLYSDVFIYYKLLP